MYVANVWIDVVVLKFTSLLRHKFQRRGGGGNMALIAIEVVPAGSKPPASVGLRTFMGERHDFGASS